MGSYRTNMHPQSDMIRLTCFEANLHYALQRLWLEEEICDVGCHFLTLENDFSVELQGESTCDLSS